ncbi:MAG: TonB-dependent receptor [Pseudomonadota bacterium]
MRNLFSLPLVLSAAIGNASAGDSAGDANVNQLPALQQASFAIPLEDALVEFARRLGISLIFDNRLIDGKFISSTSSSSVSEHQLEKTLGDVDLQLNRINATTYAITKRANVQPMLASYVSTPAPAPAPVALIDTIVVTASATAALSDATSRNLFSFDRQTLDNLAAVNVAETIYELPQSVAGISAANTSFLGAAAGLNLADLRGFGPERTLVLINGRRRTNTLGGNGTVTGFDLNTLAEPFLERIEVSPQFGAAKFGPEAAAGAINFVTRSNVDGVTAGAQYGITQRGDAEEFSVHVLGGRDFKAIGGNITLGVNHVRQNGLTGADRSVTAVPYGFALNGRQASPAIGEYLPGFGGSDITPNGELTGVLTADGNYIPSFLVTGFTVLDGTGNVEPYEARLNQLYNAFEDAQTIIPVNRTIGLIDANIDLTSSISLFAEGHIGVSRIESQIAALPTTSLQGNDPLTGDAVPISLTNPTVPAGVLTFIQEQYGPTAQSVVVSRRFIEIGPRQRSSSRRFNEAIIGADFNISNEFRGQAFYRYGRNTSYTEQKNYVDRNNLLLALDPVACAVAPGCVAVDLFERGGISQNAASFIRATALTRQLSAREHELAGDVTIRFDAGPFEALNVNSGVSLRRMAIEDRNDAEQAAQALGAIQGNNFDGAINIAEFHAAVTAPLLQDNAFLGDAELFLNYRATLSSKIGTVHNFESALEWRPIRGITVAGGYSFGERPPNLTELFLIGERVGRFFTDPCATDDTRYTENCDSQNPLSVGENFSQTQFIAQTITFGNINLDAEEVESARASVIAASAPWNSMIPGDFSLAVHWQQYNVDNMISAADGALDACFASLDFSNTTCGLNPITGAPLIQRNPSTEQIVSIDSILQNTGGFFWRGIDLEARYAFEPENLSFINRVWFSGLHTYTLAARTTSLDGTVVNELGLSDFPRHRSLLSVGLEADRLELSAFIHRRGAVQTTRQFDIPEVSIRPITTFDLTTRYALRNNIFATIAIENISDRIAPRAALAAGLNTLPQYYDILGRRFSVNLSASF